MHLTEEPKFAARPTLDIDFLGNNISNEGSSL